MTPAAILFDLDDTILTCEYGDYRKLWKKVIEDHSHHFKSISANDFYAELRRVAEEFWSDQERHREGRREIKRTRKMLVLQASRNLGQFNEEAATRLAHDYHHRREDDITPFEGALETLEYLTTTPIKTALLTNGSADIQRSKIDKFKLANYFDVVLVEGEIGIGKPSPEIYMQAIDQLGVLAQESWIVGDNLVWEVKVPQKMGFFAIWNDYLGEGLPEGSEVKPDKIVSGIRDLISMLADS